MTKIYRQGDVLIKKIDVMPKNLKKKDNTVALGEMTGHHHTFDDVANVFIDVQGRQFVELVKPSVISHQEHAPLEIPEGQYEIVIQREHDILTDVQRQVMD